MVEGALDRGSRCPSRGVGGSGLGWAVWFGARASDRCSVTEASESGPLQGGGGQQPPSYCRKVGRSGSRGVIPSGSPAEFCSVGIQANSGSSSLKCRLQKSARRISGSRSVQSLGAGAGVPSAAGVEALLMGRREAGRTNGCAIPSLSVSTPGGACRSIVARR